MIKMSTRSSAALLFFCLAGGPSSAPLPVLARDPTPTYQHESPVRRDFLRYFVGGKDLFQERQIPESLWSQAQYADLFELSPDPELNYKSDDRFRSGREHWRTHLEEEDLEIVSYGLDRPVKFWLELGSFRGSSCIRAARFLKKNQPYVGSSHYREFIRGKYDPKVLDSEGKVHLKTRPFPNEGDAGKFSVVCVDAFSYGSSFMESMLTQVQQEAWEAKEEARRLRKAGGKTPAKAAVVATAAGAGVGAYGGKGGGKAAGAGGKAKPLRMTNPGMAKAVQANLAAQEDSSDDESGSEDEPDDYQLAAPKCSHESTSAAACFGEKVKEIQAKTKKIMADWKKRGVEYEEPKALTLRDQFFYQDGSYRLMDQFLYNVKYAGLDQCIAVWQQTTLSAIRVLTNNLVTSRRKPTSAIDGKRADEERLSLDRRGVGVVERPDVIYLDSAHLQDETFMELVEAWVLLKPGGILVGDDWVLDEVHEDVLKFAELLTLRPQDIKNFWEVQKKAIKEHAAAEEGHPSGPTGIFSDEELDNAHPLYHLQNLANKTQGSGRLDVTWFPHQFSKHKVAVPRAGLFVSRTTFQWFMKKADPSLRPSSPFQDRYSEQARRTGQSGKTQSATAAVAQRPGVEINSLLKLPAELEHISDVRHYSQLKQAVWSQQPHEERLNKALVNVFQGGESEALIPFRPWVRDIFEEGSYAIWNSGLSPQTEVFLEQKLCFLSVRGHSVLASWRRQCCEPPENQTNHCWDLVYRRDICCYPQLREIGGIVHRNDPVPVMLNLHTVR